MSRATGTPTTSDEDVLGSAEVVRYLLARGLVSPRDVVERGVLVTSRSRAHLTRLVRVAGASGYVVKQSARGGGADPARLRREGAVYAAAARHPGLRDVLPASHPDPARPALLVVDLVEPGRTLLELHHAAGRCPPEAAVALGTALGRAHAAFVGERAPALDGPLPWVLDVLEHAPAQGAFAWGLAGTGEALRQLPDPARLAERLRHARTRWRPEGLIHGDVKWDNCVVAGEDPLEVRLVDWELACLGDPAWDLAGVLQEHVAFGVASGAGDVGRALARFWAAYGVAADLDAPALQARSARAAGFAGARLLQTALEHAAQLGAGSPMVPHLVREAARLLDHHDWLRAPAAVAQAA